MADAVAALVISEAVRMLWGVKAKLILALVLLGVFALSRWPGLMPNNFSAAYAIAFCAGVYLPKKLAWWLPLSALFATDVFINLFFYHVSALDSSMVANYLAFALIVWLGTKFSEKKSRTTRDVSASWARLLSGGVLGAILFYFVTNTAAWLQLSAYPKNLAGWFQALTVGLPGFPHTWEFFRNTLLSGGLFTGLFVGAMKLEEKLEPEETTEESPAPDAEEQPESV